MERLLGILRQYSILTIIILLFIGSQLVTITHIVREPHPLDWIIHLVFTGFISQLVYILLVDYHLVSKQQDKISKFPPARVILMVWFIGTAVGAWWEIVEFSLDHIFGLHLQLNNLDTMGDLIADTTGSLLGGISLIFLSQWREKR
ncbi:MAG TPA: hypothetical protein VFW90_02980 [Candidatus Saccharimonadales bacterium]|nr:hypothetical protein [Candidatus Saccharimonadales bacterium]